MGRLNKSLCSCLGRVSAHFCTLPAAASEAVGKASGAILNREKSKGALCPTVREFPNLWRHLPYVIFAQVISQMCATVRLRNLSGNSGCNQRGEYIHLVFFRKSYRMPLLFFHFQQHLLPQ